MTKFTSVTVICPKCKREFETLDYASVTIREEGQTYYDREKDTLFIRSNKNDQYITCPHCKEVFGGDIGKVKIVSVETEKYTLAQKIKDWFRTFLP